MRQWGWLVLALAACLTAGCGPEQPAADSGAKSAGSGSPATTSDGGAGKPGGQSAGGGPKVGMVSDVGGIGDLSFNMMAWNGLQRAQKELGIEPVLVESHQAS